MFTIWTARKHSRQFSEEELGWLTDILKAYSATAAGAWLDDVDYLKCEYRWCDAMDADSGILGARPLFGKDIYLAPNPNGSTLPEAQKFWIESISPIAVHELRHLWQQDVYGKVLWSIMRLPECLPFLYGKVFIERDAFDIQEEAESIIGRLHL